MSRSANVCIALRVPPLATSLRFLVAGTLLAAVVGGLYWSLRSDPMPQSNVAMAARLQALAKDPSQSPAVFRADELVRMYREIEPPPDLRSRIQLQARLAQALLAAGDSAEAIAALRQVQDALLAHPKLLPAELLPQIQSLLGIAYFRQGEQQNCLAQPSAESCLLPLQGQGVHRWREGAESARRVYLQLLSQTPDDLQSRWLLNLASAALGEHPDQVPEAQRIEATAFQSVGSAPHMLDVARESGVAVIGPSGGVVLDDFDNDGRLDLLASAWGLEDPLRSFRGDGKGGFSEHSAADHLTGLTGGLNLMQADIDNDGFLDVLVLRGAWLGLAGAQPNSLLRNLGGRGFEDITEAAGLLDAFPTQAAAWGDYDADGWIDLFVGNEGTAPHDRRSRLYRNLGSGRFEEVSDALGLTIEAFVKSALWTDLDNDGRPELFVSILGGPNRLFQYRASDGRFADIAADSSVTEPVDSFSSCAFDYDNDGREDLFVFSYPSEILAATGVDYVADYLGLPTSAERGHVFHNQGDMRFSDSSEALGLDRVLLTMGLNIGDIENDGFLDLYLGTGAPDFRSLVPNRFFRNVAGERFEDATSSAGLGHLQKGHGIAFGDVDNDGDADIYAVMGGAYSGDVYRNALFQNPGSNASRVVLSLQGKRSNRAAIGARIRLQLDTPGGPRTIYRSVNSGCSFGANPLRQEIGVGDASAVRTLDVRWPGSTQWSAVEGLGLNAHWQVIEGERSARAIVDAD